MDVINNHLAGLTVKSRANNTARSFTPAQKLPVPGNPQAEPVRPVHSPGIVPVGVTSVPDIEQDQVNMLNHLDEIIKKDMTHQIISRVLENKDAEGKKQAPDADSSSDIAVDSEDAVAQSQASQTVQQRIESLDIEVSIQQNLRIESEVEKPVEKTDPLAFDLDGNGLQTTGVNQGVSFDINADGITDHTSFITGGDAFLALDRNGNGRIDNGSELFGDQNGHANGYLSLAAYDDNNDNRIDAADSIYNHLKLFTIVKSEQVITSLSGEGIKSINLNNTETNQAINAYDTITQYSNYERDNGEEGMTGDIVLAYRSIA